MDNDAERVRDSIFSLSPTQQSFPATGVSAVLRSFSLSLNVIWSFHRLLANDETSSYIHTIGTSLGDSCFSW